MAYLLDANVFIEAKNRYYGFDVCPAFWDWIDDRNRAGVVFSIEKVAGELAGREDELHAWSAARGDQLFLKPDQPFIAAMTRVAQWVVGQPFDAGARSRFLEKADSFLVASALARGDVLVTHEKFSTSVKDVKIPVACIAFGVRVVTPFEMLRLERARFVLGPKPPVR